MSDPRPDNRLQLGHGSAWHLLRCLGWQRRRFSEAIAGAIGVERIEWLDFPLGRQGRVYPLLTPIRDGEWEGVDFASNDAREAYLEYWPTTGSVPNWDTVGTAVSAGGQELILVEAKGHPAEVKFTGTDAKEHGGRPLIRRRFWETLRACGFDEGVAEQQAEAWLTSCYQAANRLATLHFFLEQGIPTRLVFLYFCGDRHPSGTFCPSNAAEWQPKLDQLHDSLGLKGGSELEKRVHTVILNVDRITVE